MAKDCERCAYKSGFAHPKCGTCMVNYHNGVQQDLPSNFKPKPQTNADRIRAMSDEELADFITSTDRGVCTDICREMHYQHNLEWLKQPAED